LASPPSTPPDPSQWESIKDVLVPVGSAVLASVGTLWQTRASREKAANDHEEKLLATLQEQMDKEYKRLQDRIDRTETRVEKMEEEKKVLLEQNTELRLINVKLEGRSEKLDEINNQLTLQNSTLIRRNEDLEAQCREYHTVLSEFKVEGQQREMKIQALKAEVAGLRQALMDHQIKCPEHEQED
jgi:predicted nuclease with TOPRIM domain